MALYIDSAHYEEVKSALSHGVVQGVTTNPTLLLQEGENAKETLTRLASLKPQKLFIQLTRPDKAGMIEEMQHWQAILQREIIFKVPMTWPSLDLVSQDRDHYFLVTAVSSLSQCMLVAEAGAYYAAVYVERYRKRHEGENPPLAEMAHFLQGTRLLAASLHDKETAVWAVKQGAKDLTLSYKVLQAMAFDQGTEADLLGFEQDAGLLRYE